MYPNECTLTLKYLYKDYFKTKVCTIGVHGPLGLGRGIIVRTSTAVLAALGCKVCRVGLIV